MIFRQILHQPTSSYSYLVARREGGEAMLVDPLATEIDSYLHLLDQLGVTLRLAMATHSHGSDPGLGLLRGRTGCETVMGETSELDTVSRPVADGEWLELDRMRIQALLTAGHTADSTCFAMNDRVFTGDTLLIRSTGRTDLEGGDPLEQHESLFSKLVWLADHTLVYPAHDYQGWTVSSIAEEKAFNPRLQAESAADYAALMSALDIDDPSLMDVVPRPGSPWGLPPR